MIREADHSSPVARLATRFTGVVPRRSLATSKLPPHASPVNQTPAPGSVRFMARLSRRLILGLAGLCLGAPMFGGCAVEHLSDNTGRAFNRIVGKQATVRLTDLDAPKKMTAADGKLVMSNKRQDRKRSAMSGAAGAGGGATLSLAR